MPRGTTHLRLQRTANLICVRNVDLRLRLLLVHRSGSEASSQVQSTGSHHPPALSRIYLCYYSSSLPLHQFHLMALSSPVRLRLLDVLRVHLRRRIPHRFEIIHDLKSGYFFCNHKKTGSVRQHIYCIRQLL